MADESLRELEQTWRRSGDAADGARWLLARVRAGTLAPARLAWAASLYDPAAWVAAGDAVRVDGETPFGECWRFIPRGVTLEAREAARAYAVVLEAARPEAERRGGHARVYARHLEDSLRAAGRAGGSPLVATKPLALLAGEVGSALLFMATRRALAALALGEPAPRSCPMPAPADLAVRLSAARGQPVALARLHAVLAASCRLDDGSLAPGWPPRFALVLGEGPRRWAPWARRASTVFAWDGETLIDLGNDRVAGLGQLLRADPLRGSNDALGLSQVIARALLDTQDEVAIVETAARGEAEPPQLDLHADGSAALSFFSLQGPRMFEHHVSLDASGVARVTSTLVRLRDVVGGRAARLAAPPPDPWGRDLERGL